MLNSKCIVIKANCRYIQYFKQQNILHFVSAVQGKNITRFLLLPEKKKKEKKMARKVKNSTVEKESKLVM